MRAPRGPDGRFTPAPLGVGLLYVADAASIGCALAIETAGASS